MYILKGIAMNFTQLAQEVQKELDGEKLRLSQKEEQINNRATAVQAQIALCDKRVGELNARERLLQDREEEVSRRELTVRRDGAASADLQQAVLEREQANKALKAAAAQKDEARMLTEDLGKREIALSEKEKTYREEVKKQIASKMLGI